MTNQHKAILAGIAALLLGIAVGVQIEKRHAPTHPRVATFVGDQHLLAKRCANIDGCVVLRATDPTEITLQLSPDRHLRFVRRCILNPECKVRAYSD